MFKTGFFELIELNDPLGEGKEALSIHYEINPYHSTNSNIWEIEEREAGELDAEKNKVVNEEEMKEKQQGKS